MKVRIPWRALALPGLFAVVALAVLIGLGFWQLERRDWKEALLARVETRTKAPAVPMPAANRWDSVNAEEDEYRRVTAAGTFRHDLETPVYTVLPETKGKPAGPGYWVLTPLELPGGGYVVVNRGFVPLDRKDQATRRAGQVKGRVQVAGLLRMPEPRTIFTPSDDPAANAWFTRDPAAIGAARGLARVAPFTIDADAKANPGGLPLGGETRLVFRNDHLGYALTWFGLALTLVAVFGAFAWQRMRAG